MPAVGQDNNSLLPLSQDLPIVREYVIKWPWDWQVSPWWFGFAAPWGTGLERDLQISAVFYPAPPKTTKVINPGPLLEKDIIILTLRFVVIPPLQYSALAMGTEGGQMIWQARTESTGRGGIISECCYCFYFA